MIRGPGRFLRMNKSRDKKMSCKCTLNLTMFTFGMNSSRLNREGTREPQPPDNEPASDSDKLLAADEVIPQTEQSCCAHY
jgi:hypothetical protein